MTRIFLRPLDYFFQAPLVEPIKIGVMVCLAGLCETVVESLPFLNSSSSKRVGDGLLSSAPPTGAAPFVLWNFSLKNQPLFPQVS